MKIRSAVSTPKHIALAGLLIALSYVGAFLKFQGTIALDALPAFFGAIFLGPFYGGIIGALGHFFTALFSGFPLSFPLHVLISLLMMGTVQVFGVLYQKGQRVLAAAAGIILNGPISLLVLSVVSSFIGLPFHGKWMFFSLVVPLSAASAVNILGSILIWNLLLKRKLKERSL